MKTFERLFLLMIVAGLLFSCTDDINRPAEPEIVTEPFEAVFTGDYVDRYQNCDIWYGKIELKGKCTHLCEFTGYLDFPNGPVKVYGQMVAANGDILYISSQGNFNVGREPNHLEHVLSYWRGPFVILGGTGQFEGATGSGMIDDYNSSLDQNSHHHWKGYITMVKAKR
jgi:hypothetical protein